MDNTADQVNDTGSAVSAFHEVNSRGDEAYADERNRLENLSLESNAETTEGAFIPSVYSEWKLLESGRDFWGSENPQADDSVSVESQAVSVSVEESPSFIFRNPRMERSCQAGSTSECTVWDLYEDNKPFPIVRAEKLPVSPSWQPRPPKCDYEYLHQVSQTKVATEFYESCDLQLGEQEENDAVIAVALYNYETFHSLPHGTATLGILANTSAGVAGWASCEHPTEGHTESKDDANDNMKRQHVPDNNESSTHTLEDANTPHKVPKKVKRGDEEEAEQLRLALLQSMGVDVSESVYHSWPTYDVEPDSSIDGSDYEGEWSDEEESSTRATDGNQGRDQDNDQDSLSTITEVCQIVNSDVESESLATTESFVVVTTTTGTPPTSVVSYGDASAPVSFDSGFHDTDGTKLVVQERSTEDSEDSFEMV